MPIISTFSESLSECISEIMILHIFMPNFRARRLRSILTAGFFWNYFFRNRPETGP